MRREPQQARSRARVKRILEAADTILGTEGYDALTMRRIAADAKVPVGTLYQFFPTKQTIVDALVQRYLDDVSLFVSDLVTRAEQERWPDPVQVLLDAFVHLIEVRPAYLAIWVGEHLSAQARHADEENNALIAGGIRRVLIAQCGLPDVEDLARASEVSVRVCAALLRYAFRDGRSIDSEVLRELKRLLHLYLEDLLARHPAKE
jgi:AcrR family transcriptional regulator